MYLALFLYPVFLIEKGSYQVTMISIWPEKRQSNYSNTRHSQCWFPKANTMNLKAYSKDLEAIIKEKEAHIHNIEAELNLIKQSKAWRMAEYFRRLLYIKLLGRVPIGGKRGDDY